MKKVGLYFVLIQILFTGSLAASQISIMSYNVENLFDPIPNPHYNDDDFTPGGKYRWTEKRLHQKLYNLSKVITSVQNEDGSKCPDILGLQEVQNGRILKLWNDEYLQECEYQSLIINQNGPDQRGIKVALMSRFELESTPRSHYIYRGTRFIIEATFEIDSELLTVFVNHWKSRAGGGEDKRIFTANVLRERIREIQQDAPYRGIVALGDFNDEPESPSLYKSLGAIDHPHEVYDNTHQVRLWNPSFELVHLPKQMAKAKEWKERGYDIDLEKLERYYRQKRGTYFYRHESRFNQLDHILISRGLLDHRGFQYVAESFRVLKHPEFKDRNGVPRSFHSNSDANGASDHFPVLLRLQRPFHTY